MNQEFSEIEDKIRKIDSKLEKDRDEDK